MTRVVDAANCRIGHAELEFGATTVMLSDEFPEWGIRSPAALGMSPVTIHLHVDDADAMLAEAVRTGATLERPAQDQFYGERSGAVRDPFGHRWLIGHQIEDVKPEEMQRRYTKLIEPQSAYTQRSPESGGELTSLPAEA